MSITDLAIIVGFFAALSAASQGIVSFIKTLLDKWLGTPPATEPPPGQSLQGKEIVRRVAIAIIAFCAAWFSAAWFATDSNGNFGFDMCTGHIYFGGPSGRAMNIPVVVAGLLCSLGSNFWKVMLEYVTALKGIKTEDLHARRMARAQAEKATGITPWEVGRR